MRVLVATDLSAAADEAVRQAAAMAGTAGTLAAVHVLPVLQAVSMLFPQTHEREALDEAQVTARVADAVSERVARIAGRDAETFVEQGIDYAEIARRAEAWKADVVVVGSHVHSGLPRVLGGVAERVVRHVHCRALVARATTGRGGVLAANDLSEASLPATVAAAEEARRRGVALTVAHAVDFPQIETFFLLGLATPPPMDPESLRDAARYRLTTTMREAGVSAKEEILDGPAADALVREAERLGAELVVVGSHGSTGFERLLLGSVAEEIVRAAACSVLVIRTNTSGSATLRRATGGPT
jgi:nucleotide-binding universal stress UspA family protein